MNKFNVLLIASLSSGFLFSACGEENFSSKPIKPGEECFAGGTRYIVNGEESIVCHGSTLHEHVEKGQTGNPCHGAATRVTRQGEDGNVSQEWFCDTITREQLSVTGQIFLDYTAYMVNNFILNANIDTVCNELDGENSSGGYDAETLAQIYDDALNCAANVYAGLPNLQLDRVEFFHCAIPTLQESMDCIFPLPTNAVGDSVEECRGMLHEETLNCLNFDIRLQDCAEEANLSENEITELAMPLMAVLPTTLTVCKDHLNPVFQASTIP